MNRGHDASSDSCFESCSTSNTNASTSDNIIPDDAIDMILCYLTIEDLVNVADTSQRLRAIAGLVFARKYANNHVILIDGGLGHKHKLISPTRIIEFKTKQFLSFGIDKNCFRLLRNFGKFIKSIRMHFDIKLSTGVVVNDHRKSCRYVNEYIAEYCADSLEILEMNRNPMFVVHKSMPKLYKFCETAAGWYGYRDPLAVMPNLHTLIRNLRMFPDEVKHMPHLKHLAVHIETDMDVEVFHGFLRMNRQITKVTIVTRSQISMDMILFAICEHLTQLNNLKLTVKGRDPTVIITNRFETVEKFSLSLSAASAMRKNLSAFHFHKLRKLSLSEMDCDGTFLRMLSSHSQLKSIKVRKLIRPAVMTILPKLLNGWKDLEEVSVVMHHEPAGLVLLQCLGSSWEIVEQLPYRSCTTISKFKYRRLK